MAGGPAGVREPAGRERGAVRGLPVQAELVRRDGRRPSPGPADARDGELHRRAGRRPGQGLLPDRDRPLPGAAGRQRGQDGHRHGHRGVRALRVPGVQRRAEVRPRGHRPRPGRGVQAGRAPDGGHQQVRQRARRRGRRQRHHRRDRQQRQQAAHRSVLEHAGLHRAPGRGGPRADGHLRPRPQRPAQQCDRVAAAAGRGAGLSARCQLQRARADRPRRAPDRAHDGQADDRRSGPPQRARPQVGALAAGGQALLRRGLEPQLEHTGRGAADIQARRRDHALRRRLQDRS